MFTNTKKIKKAVIVFLFSLMFVFSGKAQAIEYGMLGGKPANPDPNISDSASWFIYKMAPGEKKQDTLLVMNLYEKRLDVLVYAADGTKSSGGGFALKQFAETKDEVGAWVKFYPEDVPAIFQDIFDKKEGDILEFCSLSGEDLQTAFGKNDLSDDDFASYKKWCQGTDDVKLSLPARENKKIAFTFSVPDKVDVGEHTGGILIQKAEPDDAGAEQQGSAVKLTTRVGVRIYETVPGQVVKKLSFSDFKLVKNYRELNFGRWFEKNPKPEDFLVQGSVTNSGNVSVDFQNVINIGDSFFGKRTQEINDRNFQVLKNDTFISNYSWESPRFGRYTFSMGLKYTDDQGNEQTTYSSPITIWIFPWRELIATLLVGLLIGAAYLSRKNYLKKKYGGIGWVEYCVKKTDTIASLAQKHLVDWQILVRTNKLKPPFLLEAGMLILVPSTENDRKITTGNVADGDMIEEILESEVAEEKAAEEIIEEKVTKKTKPVSVKAKAAAKIVPEAVLVAPIKKSWDKKYLIWGAIALLVGIIVVMGFLLMKKEKSAEINTELSITSLGGDTSESSIEPAAEPVAEVVEAPVKKETGKVLILNGGAAPGTAGKLGDFLKTNDVSDIEAKNAVLDTHIGVTVYYQDEYEPFAGKIIKALSEKYKDAKLQVAQDDEQKSSDVVIILGE